MYSHDNPVVKDAVLVTPSAYMQIVGMVQALAVGLLLDKGRFFQFVEDGDFAWQTEAFWLSFLQATATFQLIVLTWHIHIQNIIAVQRVFRMSDSYLPFFFIFAEYFLAVNCGPEQFSKWALSMGCFMLAASAAYWHFFRIAKQDFPENRDVMKVTENIPVFGNYLTLVYAYLSLLAVVAFLGASFADGIAHMIAAVLIDVMILVFTFIHIHFFWEPIMHARILKKPF